MAEYVPELNIREDLSSEEYSEIDSAKSKHVQSSETGSSVDVRCSVCQQTCPAFWTCLECPHSQQQLEDPSEV